MNIKKHTARYLAGFFYLVLGVGVLFGAVIGVIIFSAPECAEEQALAKANSISASHWAAIFAESVNLLNESTSYEYAVGSLPEGIAALEPVHVVSMGSTLWIYLATCGLDSKVIIFVNTSEERGQDISISWGDPAQSLDLWQVPE